MTFGEYLRSLRKAKGWTLVHTAVLAGMRHPNLSEYETGRRYAITAPTVVKLNKTLGGDLRVMLRLSGALPPEVLALIDEGGASE